MRVWLYYRLSRDEDDELNSLTNQRKIIYEYAVTNGHEAVSYTHLDEYKRQFSARPRFSKCRRVVYIHQANKSRQ